MDHRTASGEVRGEPARPADLADKIALRLWALHIRARKTAAEDYAPLIRESLAPIREALEETVERTWNDQPVGTKLSVLHDGIARALHLLRGEELSGNRGVVNETKP